MNSFQLFVFKLTNMIAANGPGTAGGETATGGGGNIFSSIIDWVVEIGEKILYWVWAFIMNTLYILVKWALNIVDFLQLFVFKLVGIDYWSDSTARTATSLQDSDLILRFIFSEGVTKAFYAVLGVAIVLLIVFSIVAIIKNEYATATADDGKIKGNFGTVIKKMFRSLFLFVSVPILLVFGVIASNAILAGFYNALKGENNLTLGGQIFVASSYEASRYRIYASGGKRIPIIYADYSELVVPNDYMYVSSGDHNSEMKSFFAKVLSGEIKGIDDSIIGFPVRDYSVVVDDYNVQHDTINTVGVPNMKAIMVEGVSGSVFTHAFNTWWSRWYSGSGDYIQGMGMGHPVIKAIYNGNWTYNDKLKDLSFDFDETVLADATDFLSNGGTSINTVVYKNNHSVYQNYENFAVLDDEYYVIADFIDYAIEQGIEFYIVEARNSQIKWNDSLVNNDLIKTNGTELQNFVVQYASGRSRLYEPTDFDVSASQSENNGAVYIMCTKSGDAFIPVTAGTTNTKTNVKVDDTQYTKYSFRSNYLKNGYNGIIVARGIFDEEGRPTEIRTQSVNENTGNILGDTEPVYITASPVFGAEDDPNGGTFSGTLAVYNKNGVELNRFTSPFDSKEYIYKDKEVKIPASVVTEKDGTVELKFVFDYYAVDFSRIGANFSSLNTQNSKLLYCTSFLNIKELSSGFVYDSVNKVIKKDGVVVITTDDLIYSYKIQLNNWYKASSYYSAVSTNRYTICPFVIELSDSDIGTMISSRSDTTPKYLHYNDGKIILANSSKYAINKYVMQATENVVEDDFTVNYEIYNDEVPAAVVGRVEYTGKVNYYLTENNFVYVVVTEGFVSDKILDNEGNPTIWNGTTGTVSEPLALAILADSKAALNSLITAYLTDEVNVLLPALDEGSEYRFVYLEPLQTTPLYATTPVGSYINDYYLYFSRNILKPTTLTDISLFAKDGFLNFAFRIKLFQTHQSVALKTLYHLDNGSFALDYNFYESSGITMGYLFNPGAINPIILLFSTAIIFTVLMQAVWALIARIYEIVILFLVMPGFVATIPLDEGDRFKKWREQVVKKVLSAYGVILTLSIFFILVPVIRDATQIFKAEDFINSISLAGGAMTGVSSGMGLSVAGISGSFVSVINNVMVFVSSILTNPDYLNRVIYILFLLVAITLLKSAPVMITDILGGEDLLKKGADVRDNVGKTVSSVAKTVSGSAAKESLKKLGGEIAESPLGKLAGRLGSGITNRLGRASGSGSGAMPPPPRGGTPGGSGPLPGGSGTAGGGAGATPSPTGTGTPGGGPLPGGGAGATPSPTGTGTPGGGPLPGGGAGATPSPTGTGTPGGGMPASGAASPDRAAQGEAVENAAATAEILTNKKPTRQQRKFAEERQAIEEEYNTKLDKYKQTHDISLKKAMPGFVKLQKKLKPKRDSVLKNLSDRENSYLIKQKVKDDKKAKREQASAERRAKTNEFAKKVGNTVYKYTGAKKLVGASKKLGAGINKNIIKPSASKLKVAKGQLQNAAKGVSGFTRKVSGKVAGGVKKFANSRGVEGVINVFGGKTGKAYVAGKRRKRADNWDIVTKEENRKSLSNLSEAKKKASTGSSAANTISMDIPKHELPKKANPATTQKQEKPTPQKNIQPRRKGVHPDTVKFVTQKNKGGSKGQGKK